MIGTFSRVLLILILSSALAEAQQYPQFSQFNYNLNVYNPAYTGIKDEVSVTAQARAQWVGINGAPLLQAVTTQVPIYTIHGGIGLTLVNNMQGLQRNTYAGVDYSFIIRKKNHVFAIGAKAGIIQASLDGSKIITPQGVYGEGLIDHNDAILPTGLSSNISPDAAVGVLYSGKVFTFGISCVNLTQPKLALTGGSLDGPVLDRTFFAHFSYNIKLSDNVIFRNAFLVKYDSTGTQEETNITFEYKSLGWIGAGFRGVEQDNTDAVYALLGIKVAKNWVIGYSYDYILSSLNKASTGSHEIIVNYAFGLSEIAKPGKFIYTPRY